VEKQRCIDFHTADLNRLLEIEQQLLKESSSSSGDPTSQNDNLPESPVPNPHLALPSDTQGVERMVATYEQELARREAAQYRISRPSSCSMDIVTATEHRAITLSRPYYDQAGSTAQVQVGKQSEPAAPNLTGTASSPMDVVEPSVNQASEALVAHAPPQTPVTHRLTGPNSFFAGGPFLPADEVDDERHQHDHALALWTQNVGRGPLPRHHPAAVGTPESQLVIRSPEGNRKKRARNFAVLNPTDGEAMPVVRAEIPVVREEREVEGAEERKGECTPVEARSPPSGGETRHQSAPHPNFSGLEAMRKYSILAEGAREGGPDYIPRPGY